MTDFQPNASGDETGKPLNDEKVCPSCNGDPVKTFTKRDVGRWKTKEQFDRFVGISESVWVTMTPTTFSIKCIRCDGKGTIIDE